MKFGYARVSTRDQNLEAQLDALTTAGCDKIITEKASGNGSKESPELDRLVGNLREGDVLVVYKLNRLGRSTFKLLGLTEELQQRGVEFVSLKDHIDSKQRHRQSHVPHAGRPGCDGARTNRGKNPGRIAGSPQARPYWRQASGG